MAFVGSCEFGSGQLLRTSSSGSGHRRTIASRDLQWPHCPGCERLVYVRREMTRADTSITLAFFQSIALSTGNSLQDTLRLLTLWFKYGYHAEVGQAISEGFRTVSVDIWLEVIPQVRLIILFTSPPSDTMFQ